MSTKYYLHGIVAFDVRSIVEMSLLIVVSCNLLLSLDNFQKESDYSNKFQISQCCITLSIARYFNEIQEKCIYVGYVHIGSTLNVHRSSILLGKREEKNWNSKKKESSLHQGEGS